MPVIGLAVRLACYELDTLWKVGRALVEVSRLPGKVSQLECDLWRAKEGRAEAERVLRSVVVAKTLPRARQLAHEHVLQVERRERERDL